MKYLLLSIFFGLAALVFLFAATSIAPELPVRWAQSPRELVGQLLFLASMGGFLTAFGMGCLVR
jgi:hypothetical protein